MGNAALDEERVLTVVIPAYNEAATIKTILEKVDAQPCVREIIVVDDGSTDRTAALVESFDSPRVRLIRQSPNSGKTAAVKRGIAEASSPILSGQADVGYGSRFLVRRATRVLYFYHYLANKFLTFCSNLLTNLNMTDIETCYKAFRTPIIKQIPLTSTGFGMEVEITAMVSKTCARVYEVPISYYGRTYAEGKKIGLSDGVHAMWYILYYNVILTPSSRHRACVRSINQWLESEVPGCRAPEPEAGPSGSKSR